MPITQKEQVSPCEISLEIEVDSDAVKKAFDKAYKEAGKHTQVPGFRKGKAPRAILEKFVSEEHIKEHAAEELVYPAYEEALKEAEIEPFAAAEYEVVQLEDAEPFKFKAKIPLPPAVELGNYKGVEVERFSRQVSDEDVDQEIETLRQRSAKVENVEGRPVQMGDLAIITLTEPDGESRETVVEAGRNLPSFDEGLVGMNKDETKSIELVYPDDYEEKELAGTKSVSTVTIKDIKERHLPELNDDFVKEVTKGSPEKIETVQALKDKIRSKMEEAASELADKETQSKIVDKVVEASKIDFPEVMLHHEVSHRLKDLVGDLKSRDLTLDDYLDGTGRTFEELQSRMEESAAKDIRVSLVLSEIAEKEKIEATDEDVEEEITKMAEESGYPRESVAAYVDRTESKDALKNRILRRKVLDFLVDASNTKSVGQKKS
ncbi:MAG: trigger factor [Armatimonadota bacterium]